MIDLNENYWEERYQKDETGWDIGYASPAIINYFQNIKNKEAKILIPGCGNAYEGEVLFNAGFENLYLLDFAESSKANFLNRVPIFPEEQFLVGDFFEHEGSYDFIVEQTFFCALNPEMRSNYVIKMSSLLKDNGKLVGLMFNIPLFQDHPPFGGNATEYRPLFEKNFIVNQMDICQDSIPQRMGNELFIELLKIS